MNTTRPLLLALAAAALAATAATPALTRRPLPPPPPVGCLDQVATPLTPEPVFTLAFAPAVVHAGKTVTITYTAAVAHPGAGRTWSAVFSVRTLGDRGRLGSAVMVRALHAGAGTTTATGSFTWARPRPGRYQVEVRGGTGARGIARFNQSCALLTVRS